MHETFSRIQTLHGSRGPRACGASQRHTKTRRGAPQASSQESESARTEAQTKGQAFRFGPPFKRPALVGLFFSHVAGDIGPRSPIAAMKVSSTSPGFPLKRKPDSLKHESSYLTALARFDAGDSWRAPISVPAPPRSSVLADMLVPDERTVITPTPNP